MNQLDPLLWRALEGALGAEKTAFLRNAPLTDLVAPGTQDFSAADAAGHIAKKASLAREETRALQASFKAMRALGLRQKEASAPPLRDKIALAHKLRILEDHASEDDAVKTASYRHALYEDIVDTIKEASVGGTLAGISSNPMLRDLGKKILQGGALATGAGVPAYAAGSALSDKFTEDARNRALQTAAGVGGLALVGYGGKKLMDTAAQDHARGENYEAMLDHQRQSMSDQLRMQQAQQMLQKQSSVATCLGQVLPREKAAHLATAVYLDELLSSVDQNEKVAGVRRLNREFIVDELLTKEANRLTAIADYITAPTRIPSHLSELASVAQSKRNLQGGSGDWLRNDWRNMVEQTERERTEALLRDLKRTGVLAGGAAGLGGVGYGAYQALSD